jgi:tetratricopeptide (TPR) repeat protein
MRPLASKRQAIFFAFVLKRMPRCAGAKLNLAGGRCDESDDHEFFSENAMILRLLLAAIASSLPMFASSYAACVYPPFEFHPEKNGGVQVPVRVDQGSSCRHSFLEGPGYHFTKVAIGNLPPHGTLKETGKNAFLYTPGEKAKGGDVYTFEICATKGKQAGCTLIIFEVQAQDAAPASKPSTGCGDGSAAGWITACTPIIDDPKSPVASRMRALKSRGIAYFYSRDLDRAFADFSTAIELDPADAQAYSNRGLVSQWRNDLDGAKRDYDRAIALDPKLDAGFANRGNLYRWKGDWTQAVADYDRALSLNPALGHSYLGRGIARQRLNDLNGALADLTKALEFDPRTAEKYAARGNVLALKGEDEKALADFDRAAELASQHPAGAVKEPGIYEARGKLLFERGEYRRALADFDTAIQGLKPGGGLQIYGDRGRLRFALGEFPAAAADFAKLRGASPPDPYTALWLYFAQARNGNPDKSVLKELAGGTAWPSPIARFLLGGSPREELDSAARQGDENTRLGQSCETSFYLGEQALVEKREDEAKTLIRQAAEICPRGFIERGAALAEWRRLRITAN